MNYYKYLIINNIHLGVFTLLKSVIEMMAYKTSRS